MRNFFKRKEKIQTVQNLPDLIRKINRNELIDYKEINIEEKSLKDPLYLRIQIEEIDYIKENLKEIPFYKKILILPIKIFINKQNVFSKFRYEKEIYRPSIELRKMHYGRIPGNVKATWISYYIVVLIFVYIVGYFWARLKFDIYLRRHMYLYYFSYMMAFEFIDYHAGILLDKFNSYFPKEMTDKELEFILYKKIASYFVKKKLSSKVDEILNTDPELLEIDKIIKKI